MLKNYTYNHIYLLNVFVMLNQKRFMLDEMTTRKMANFEEFSLVNNNILLISEECNTLGNKYIPMILKFGFFKRSSTGILTSPTISVPNSS